MGEHFTPIRNGLLEHIRKGKLIPFDLGIYVFIQLRADWKTGIYRGCALSIAHDFNQPGLNAHIQKALRRLRDQRYINYPKGCGRRGGYDVLIHKYFVTVGELSGHRLNAWKHGELCKPEYERWNGDGTETELRRNRDGTETERVLDLLDYTDNLDVLNSAGAQKSAPPPAPPKTPSPKKCGGRISENFCVTEEHRQFAREHQLPDPDSLVGAFIDFWKAVPGAKGMKLDWNATFRNWLRNEVKFGGTNGNGLNKAQRIERDNLAAAAEVLREMDDGATGNSRSSDGRIIDSSQIANLPERPPRR